MHVASGVIRSNCKRMSEVIHLWHDADEVWSDASGNDYSIFSLKQIMWERCGTGLN